MRDMSGKDSNVGIIDCSAVRCPHCLNVLQLTTGVTVLVKKAFDCGYSDCEHRFNREHQHMGPMTVGPA